jgi:prolyl-tRNA editing enzyme YbaK/EbsC (Cys-tRNA(Pro) deacylase)
MRLLFWFQSQGQVNVIADSNWIQISTGTTILDPCLPTKSWLSHMPNYSEKLKLFLTSKNVWHRLIEFNEPVKTVEQAGRKVPVEKIVKSIVMVDSDGGPLVAVVPAKNKVSHRKTKSILDVRDVRLANPEEVLKHSGYPAGGVPPFNDIKRVLVDPQVLMNETAVVGGGDVDKLMEIRTKDLVDVLNARVADISQD